MAEPRSGWRSPPEGGRSQSGADAPGVVLVSVDELGNGLALDVLRQVIVSLRVLLDVVVLYLRMRPKPV